MASPIEGSGIDLSFRWQNATRAVQYTLAKPGTATMTCDQGTAATDFPLGIIQNVPAQNDHATVRVSGVTYAVAGAAITINSIVLATTAGKLIDAGTRDTTPVATREYVVGIALSSAAADGELFTLLIRPSETSET